MPANGRWDLIRRLKVKNVIQPSTPLGFREIRIRVTY